MHETGLRGRIRSVLREPLLHSLLLGAVIYVVYGLAATGEEADPENRITVTAGEIDWLATSWSKRWNRPPTPEERAGLIDEYVRETIFYREALAMGLDRDDTIIRRRLTQKLEFLSQDLIAAVPPTEEDLRAFFTEHAERYQLAALTTFTQVFVDPDKRGDRTLADAEAIAAELRALEPPTEGAAQLGDPFMLQSYYPERSELEIAKLFGAEFAGEVGQLEPGRWHGPVLSGYGTHLVYVEAHSEALPAEFAAVRERVQQDWEDERRRVFDEEFYARLRDRYEIVIAKAPTFAIWAVKDPESGNLDRIQVVKGWVEKGKPRERIYDVALSDDRTLDAKSGKAPPVGNTVDIAKATYTNDIGDSQLSVVWQDPDFDASQRAVYYVRVLEIPTPRWSTYDAAKLGVDPPKSVPATIQERAWSSPIWYTPPKDNKSGA